MWPQPFNTFAMAIKELALLEHYWGLKNILQSALEQVQSAFPSRFINLSHVSEIQEIDFQVKDLVLEDLPPENTHSLFVPHKLRSPSAVWISLESCLGVSSEFPFLPFCSDL